jgi:hypothetical protein
MIGFALSPIYWLSLIIMFAVGAGSSMFNVSIQQNLQLLVTNEFRGRVMGVWSIVHSSIRPLGEMQFSGLAALVAAPFAVVFGGAMMIGGGVFLVAFPRTVRQLIDMREASVAEAEPPSATAVQGSAARQAHATRPAD